MRLKAKIVRKHLTIRDVSFDISLENAHDPKNAT
jgi:hypothetical protein